MPMPFSRIRLLRAAQQLGLLAALAWISATSPAQQPQSSTPAPWKVIELLTPRELSPGEWLRFGFPLAPTDRLKDGSTLELWTEGGRRWPARIEIASRRGAPVDQTDAPATWLHIETACPPAPGKTLLLRRRDATVPLPSTAPSLKLTRKDDGEIQIETPTLDLVLAPGDRFLRAMHWRGIDDFTRPSGQLHLVDEQGKALPLPNWTLEVVKQTAATATVLARCRAFDLEIEARLHIVAFANEVVVDFRIVNPGPYGHGKVKPATRYFQRMAWQLPGPRTAANATLGGTALKIPESGAIPSAALLQQHRLQFGKKPVEKLPFELWQGSKRLAAGERGDGLFVADLGSKSYGVGVESFFENAPKALSVSAGLVLVDLFPLGGSGPPYQGRYGRPLDGKTRVDKRAKTAYRFEGARAKTTRLRLGVVDATGDPGEEELRARLAAPVGGLPRQLGFRGEAILGQYLVPYSPRSSDVVRRYERTMSLFVENGSADRLDGGGQMGLPAFRERGGTWGKSPFYGWMNWGDLPWGDGYSSNHYDLPFSVLFQFLRRRDARFLQVGSRMAEHRRDIDQDHDQKSSAIRRGGQFYEKGHWHGNFGSPTPSHTWVGGPVLHWLLTGDEGSRIAAELNREFFKRNRIETWDGRWGARIPGWTIEALMHLYEAFGQESDRKLAEDIARQVEKQEKGQGGIFNRGYNPPVAKPWMHAILFNAIARHAETTGSKEFHPLLGRLLGFLKTRGLRQSKGRWSAWRIVRIQDQDTPSSHLLWPVAASLTRAHALWGRPEDLELARALSRDACRTSGGGNYPVSFYLRNFPDSESKILSNVALWGGTALRAWQ